MEEQFSISTKIITDIFKDFCENIIHSLVTELPPLISYFKS